MLEYLSWLLIVGATIMVASMIVNILFLVPTPVLFVLALIIVLLVYAKMA